MPALKWLALILLALPLAAQEPTITLNGTAYTMQPHPRVFLNAALNARVAYSGGLAPKAVSSNPAWVAMTTRAGTACSIYPDPSTTHNDDSNYVDGTIAEMYAQWWYSDNSQTACLAKALYLVNNMQQYVPFVCNEGVMDCIHGGNGYWVGSYGPAYYMPNWVFAYELVRGQMTTLQQQTFADKWLNDKAAWGGINGSPSTGCTNPTLVGTTSVSINSSGVVTASAPYFGSGQTLQVGDWIASSSNDFTAVIASVSSSTVATIEQDQWSNFSGYSGTLYSRRGGWSAGDCGWFWVAKHDWYAPASIIGSSVYPSGAGNGGVNGTGSFNLVLAQTYGPMAALLSLADDDVNFSSRTSVEITALYNYWHTTTWTGLNEFNYTGFTPTGSVYGITRAWAMWPLTAFSVVNSVVSPPPLLNGLWAKNMTHHTYLATFPSCPAQEWEFGQSFSLNSSYNSYLPNAIYIPSLITMFQGTNEGQYLNWWSQNLWQTCPNGGYSGNTPGTNLMWNSSTLGSNQYGGTSQAWAYLYMDSAYATNSALPTGSVDNCSDAGCSGAVATSVALPMAGLISRTGYSSITDTLTEFLAISAPFNDHTTPYNGIGQPGDIRIWKGAALLGDDYTTWNNGGISASDISIGSDSYFPSAPVYTVLMPAGANDPSNRYTYALVDMTQSYSSSAHVTGAERYFVHFKKPGTQDFVVVYDYVKTSTAEQVIQYSHYPQPTHTTLTCPTVAESFPGTGHSDATQLLTAFLQPAGSNTTYCYSNNTNGTYAGGNGNTFRVSNCGSVTGSSCAATSTYESATVHMPVAGSGNSMPSTETLATIDGNHRGIEIDGSSSKVAVFPIGISEPCFTSATYTTAVPSTAQQLVAGLCTGSYNVTVGGSPVVSGVAVSAGNNSLYFEYGSGAVAVSLASATLTLPSPSCPAGTQYVAYGGCTLAASGGTPPYTYAWVNPTTSYASIPEGLSVNASTGAISGTVYGQGGYVTQFKATDAASNTATTTVTFAIAGNNTLGGCTLFPATSAFHINVSGLSVDTSPAAAIQSGYLSSTIKPLFGAAPQSSNFPNGIPFLVVPYNQTDVSVTTTVYQSYFTSAPFPPYAPIESTSNAAGTSDNDNHTLIVQTTGSGSPYCQLWEMWQGLPPYTNGLSGNAWKDSSNAYWDNLGSTGSGAYGMLPQGNGSTDAAGLPVTPLLVNADEVIGTGTPSAPTGAVQHPIRFTVSTTLGAYVWPATAKAGSGTCTGGYSDGNHQLMQANPPASCTTTMPMGEIYRLKSSVTSPSCASSSPQSAIIITGLRNYGIILADNGETGGIIGTPDSRWNDADLACLSNLTLTDFEPVNVGSLIANLPSGCPGTNNACEPLASYETTAGATYAITVAYAGAGSGTTSGTNVPGSGLAPGTSWTATGTPATGSNCVSMTDTLGGTPSGCSDSGRMPSSNGVVTTTFALNSYTVSTSTTGTGAISGCAGSQLYGASWTCNETPGAGYSFSSWGGTCGCTGSATSCTKTQGAANCTVTATFAATTYTLSTSITGSGTLTGTNCPASGLTVGTGWSCTASPSAGYTLSSLSDTCGGTVVVPVDSGTMPASNCAVSVIFAATTSGRGVLSNGTLNSGTLP